MNIRMIFFDLDDTLHDHLKPFSKSLETCFPDAFQSLDPEAVYKAFRAHSDRLWDDYSQEKLSLSQLRRLRIQLGLEDFDVWITDDEAGQFQKLYEDAANHIHFFSEVPELFQKLSSKRIKIGLITNGPVAHQQRKIKALGLNKYISEDLIFISDAVGIAKPDPGIFEYAIQKETFEPHQLAYVGDTWNADIEGAHAAGWYPIWFNHRKRKQGSEIEHHLITDNLLDILKIIDK